jgi:DNA-binding NarL/FixJ family response regulator
VAWLSGGGRADLAIQDLAMPGLDGAATFEALRRLEPNLRVLVTSGYERDGRVQALLDRGAVGFLAKPWRRDQLAAGVAGALAAAR